MHDPTYTSREAKTVQTNDNATPFRDVIRERNAVRRSTEALAEFEAKSPSFIDRDWAAWSGRLSVHVEDLLAVVANLQTVADHAEGGQS